MSKKQTESKKRGAPTKSTNQCWHGKQKKRNFLLLKDHDDFLQYKKSKGEKPSIVFRKLIEADRGYQAWKEWKKLNDVKKR